MDDTHHVAWADRIGLNKQWSRDIQSCGEAFGTSLYPGMVRRFMNNVPNIKNGPQLRKNIDMFREGELKKMQQKQYSIWIDGNPQKAKQQSYVRAMKDDLDYWGWEETYKYIIQMLEDNGFCFYESKLEVDEVSLDD